MAVKITVSRIEYSYDRLPKAFDGFRILHVSDLHNHIFGVNQCAIIKQTADVKPDMIAVTGDLIDKRRTDIDAAMVYLSGAAQVAPIYFVAGNHEKQFGKYEELSRMMSDCGVVVLDDRRVNIEKDNARIAVIGMRDQAFSSDEEYARTLKMLSGGENSSFKILLTHKPRIHTYSMFDIDLVLCGHAHGGQFRIPGIGGLYSPEQGIFPKYTSGLHTQNGTAMIISRGLGNSIFPIRLFNGPELIVVTLKTENAGA